jgi:hypothetical protein
VRLAIEGDLAGQVESVELRHLGTVPAVPTVRWRQQMVERAASRAADLAADGRHLLVAGDPVVAGEVLAAASTDKLDVAVCLLDADDRALGQRLDRRRDPAEIRGHHLAYAAWLRAYADDPTHFPEVLTTNSWEGMKWARWIGLPTTDPRWKMTVIDTSDLSAEQASGATRDWVRDALAGQAPILPAGLHRSETPD